MQSEPWDEIHELKKTWLSEMDRVKNLEEELVGCVNVSAIYLMDRHLQSLHITHERLEFSRFQKSVV